MGHVLCKYGGCLVIAEVHPRSDNQPGKCPECGGTEFTELAGWTECDCGFAYLTSDLLKIQKEVIDAGIHGLSDNGAG